MANAVRSRERLAARPGFGSGLRGDVVHRLVQPLIVFSAGEDERHATPSLPGQYLLSVTEAVREARAAARAGLAGVLLFAAPDRHDETAVLASERDWVVPRAVRAIKDAVPELGVATDVCVCAYTRHGQCVLFGQGAADLDATFTRLAEIAVAHAEAGADLVVPSGALRGGVAAIRRALDGAGAGDVAVAGAVKFASGLYEPYRAAVGMAHASERAVPLVPPGDARAALAAGEAARAEGADLLVVKPGLITLDVIASLRALDLPLAAFHVAGEHVMLRASEDSGLDAVTAEAVLATRRAGADLVVSYDALAVAERLAVAPA